MFPSKRLSAFVAAVLAVAANAQSSGSTTTSTTSSAASSTSSAPASSAMSSSAMSSSVISSTSSTIPPTETGRSTLPISSYPFTPYPTPSDPPPLTGVFPSASPLNPPAVSSDPTIVPDFGPAWAEAWSKAQALVSSLSMEGKVNITTGNFWMGGLCVGNINPISDNGTYFPGLCLQDSPLGVRYTDFVTAFPAGINAAATWNRALIRQRGAYMGAEFKAKGVNVALGPMMNMGRNPEGGRNWEGFGADPFLSGASAYETILGMQSSGVQATAKHYINNEQEWKRTQESSNVDDRTEHEIYLAPFLKSVMAGVASVMCSYNLINDTYACENDRTLNQILKTEFGFQGYIQSDWSATMSTLSAVAGLDMTMPGDITFGSGTSYFGGNLTAFVMNGTIAASRLDDMATRIAASWYFLGQDQPGYPNEDHYELVRQMGASSAVLLKNNGVLPLKNIRSYSIIGSDAGPGLLGPNGYSDRGGDDGVLAMGWGSGSDQFPYLITPLEAIQARARLNRSSVNWVLNDYDYSLVQSTVAEQNVAIVFVNADSGEGYINVGGNLGDRNNLTAWHGGDALILAVAGANNNTIVVTHSVGPLIIEPWVDHPNVTAILWAGIAGQEVGNALVDVLFGDWNPSGRLPYTIAKNASDYPSEPIDGGAAAAILKVDYNEGLFIDYRWFDAMNITPRYEFGYGLSYSTFEYSKLCITPVANVDSYDAAAIANWEAGLPSPWGAGSSTAFWLHTPAYTITFDLTNTGAYYGGEIPQLYVHFPTDSGEPPSVLKGFTNANLNPGETQSVTISISRYDLSIWDVAAQSWVKPAGNITFTVGASSRDGRLYGTVPV
ncbi:glycoside hydrolase family 3 protein [Jaapia argillacea MUCL 33604]|uniref:beta-glucosidase n=1 Tax=Jaapia argillacea MUCL 33604 TaxID=933084 RepID=A0A067PC31_9AGAM|nr:glycoside hydrolase family 3 protein [Jaapia argillacea MUCL 33604]